MLLTLKSMLTVATHTRDIAVDLTALVACMDGTDRREIKEIFPHLSKKDIDFLKSGTIPEELEVFMRGQFEYKSQRSYKIPPEDIPSLTNFSTLQAQGKLHPIIKYRVALGHYN